MNAIVSIDWLQIYGYMPWIAYQEPQTRYCYGRYEMRMSQIKVASFRLHYEFFTPQEDKIAELLVVPNIHKMRQDMCLLKVENRFLYQGNPVKIVEEICSAYEIQIAGLTRLDVCADFQECADGSEPQDFLQKIVAGIYSIKSYRKMTSIQKVSTREVEYVRFGSNDSEVRAYVYNKSKELKEQHDKPWIREIWENAGFDANKDTYRAEISIKGRAMDIINEETGELTKLGLHDTSNAKRIFQMYGGKYLFFIDTTTGKRKRKNMPRVVLLPETVNMTEYRPISITRYIDSGRSEKACANLLKRYMTMQLGAKNEQAVWAAYHFLMDISKLKSELVELKEIERVLQLDGITYEHRLRNILLREIFLTTGEIKERRKLEKEEKMIRAEREAETQASIQ